MKRTFFVLAVATLALGRASAQGVAPGASGPPSPDCYASGSFAAVVTTSTAVSQSLLSNATAGCTIFHLNYTATSNVSAISIQVDVAPPGATAGSVGSFAAATGTSFGSSNPATTVPAAEIAVAPPTPSAFVRVTLNSATVSGTGVINYVLMGYRPGITTTPGAGFGTVLVAASTPAAVLSATGTASAINLGAMLGRHTVQVAVTGSPATCSIQLEGTLDNATSGSANWANLSGAQTCTSTVTFHVVDRIVTAVRINLTVLTGGSSPTVTVRYGGGF